MAYHRYHGVDVRIVRIFNTYGPRMRPDDGRVVSNFLVQALAGKPLTIYGDGTQTRSFCYVDDEVRGLLALLDSDHVGPVNIGNPDEFTVRQLAELVLEVTGSTSEIVFEPLPDDDPTQRRPDITLAREVLGWEPEVQLREGLERTADWFRDPVGDEPWMTMAVEMPGGGSGGELLSSVIVPVFNERNTVVEILRRMRQVELPVDLEIVVVDDGSDDGTEKVLGALEDSTVRVLTHATNQGKAACIRTALAVAQGDLVLIQDADLEYDPDDWPRLLAPILKGRAKVVYGSRFIGERATGCIWHWVGNRFLVAGHQRALQHHPLRHGDVLQALRPRGARRHHHRVRPLRLRARDHGQDPAPGPHLRGADLLRRAPGRRRTQVRPHRHRPRPAHAPEVPLRQGGRVTGRVGAVIVNYNAGDHLVACVRSLRADGVESVVVVDNGSTDGSVADLAETDSDDGDRGVGRNLGFGGGANRGGAPSTRESDPGQQP